MLTLAPTVPIFLCRDPADLRKSFDGLAALVREALGADPLSGHLFVFRNKRGDRLKILLWDRDGFLIFYKKLESHCPHFLPFTEFGGDADNLAGRLAAAVGMDSDSTRNGPRRRPMSREITVIAPPRAQFWDSP